VWNDGLDGVGVGALNDSLGSSLSSVLDWNHLVTDGGKNILEHVDEVWLDSWADLAVVGNSTDGVQRTLSCKGILLVVELLPEHLYSSITCVSGVSQLYHISISCSLCWCILLLNVTVDEDGNLLGRGVDLILLLGDSQL